MSYNLVEIGRRLMVQQILQYQQNEFNRQQNQQITQIEKEEYTKEAWSIDSDITDQLYEYYQEKDGLPWTAVTIDNRGPDNLYYAANHWKGGSIGSLEEGESYEIDFKQRDSIKKLFLKTDDGQQTVAHLHIIK